MAVPPVFCSENCGSVDTVSEFYRVFVPIQHPFFIPYHTGVLYSFVAQEPTRCVWERDDTTGSPWLIERLSRYPEGWEFPEIEPVAGKWTWRLSIDAIFPVPFLHGWKRDFPRFDILDPDPLHNCSIGQALVNYVPIVTRPDVLIVPFATSTPPDLINQTTSPCYCSDNCPIQSKPHEKYLVTIPGTPFLPGYDLGVLYDVVSSGISACAFQPVAPQPPPATEDLDKRNIAPTVGDHAYKWVLVLQKTVGNTRTWDVVVEWNDDGNPLEPLPARCNLPRALASTTAEPDAQIRGVPEWICTDVQARAWAAKYPLP